MKSITHEQAQRWLQARMDGMFNAEDGLVLDAHLHDCPDCRQYAAQIHQLDAHLRDYFQTRPRLSPRHTAAHLPSGPAPFILNKVRANMIAKRMWNAAHWALYVTGLVALVVLLGFVTSRYFSPLPQDQPGLPGTTHQLTQTPALPQPTLTPTLDSRVFTTPEPVIEILNQLAQSSTEGYQQPGWYHTTRQDLGREGTIATAFFEMWAHYPGADGRCTEMLGITKANQTAAEPLQLQLWTEADDALAELVSLRKGQSQVQTGMTGDLFCTAKPETTAAGQLAARLSGNGAPRKDAGRDLKAVKAWYEYQNGQPVLTVQAHFENPGSTPPEQIETYQFDALSGHELTETTRAQWADGSLFSETSTAIQVDYFASLPADVAQAFAQATEELRAFQSGTAGAAATATVTAQPPAAQTGSAPWDSVLAELPAYSAEAPLKDGQRLLQALEALRQRQIAYLTRPGWYVNGNIAPPPSDELEMDPQVILHVLENGQAEQVTYYRKGEQILPQEIRLADGAYGIIGPVDGGQLSDEIFMDAPRTPENNRVGEWLFNEIETVRGMLADTSGTVQAEYGVWVEQLEGRPVLVESLDLRYSDGLGVMMDPKTRQLEPIDREIKRQYFDLETGIYASTHAEYYLANGEVVVYPPDAEAVKTLYQVVYYPELPPAPLAAAFEGAINGVKALLAEAP